MRNKIRIGSDLARSRKIIHSASFDINEDNLTPWKQTPKDDLPMLEESDSEPDSYIEGEEERITQNGQNHPTPPAQSDELGIRKRPAKGGKEEATDDITPKTKRTRQPSARIHSMQHLGITRSAFHARQSHRRNDPVLEPTYKQALESPEAPKLIKAMEEEYGSLTQKGTWDKDLVDLPRDKRALACKWVFKLKLEKGKIVRTKHDLLL